MDWAEAVQKETEAFRGTTGVVVSSLADGRRLSHNADRVFSSASLIKLGVLYTLFSKHASGEIDLDEVHGFSSAECADGGLLHRVRSGARLRLADFLNHTSFPRLSRRCAPICASITIPHERRSWRYPLARSRPDRKASSARPRPDHPKGR